MNTEPEPEFAGMSWYEICQVINEYEHEMMFDQWLYENRAWFKDYNPYNGSY